MFTYDAPQIINLIIELSTLLIDENSGFCKVSILSEMSCNRKLFSRPTNSSL